MGGEGAINNIHEYVFFKIFQLSPQVQGIYSSCKYSFQIKLKWRLAVGIDIPELHSVDVDINFQYVENAIKS